MPGLPGLRKAHTGLWLLKPSCGQFGRGILLLDRLPEARPPLYAALQTCGAVCRAQHDAMVAMMMMMMMMMTMTMMMMMMMMMLWCRITTCHIARYPTRRYTHKYINVNIRTLFCPSKLVWRSENVLRREPLLVTRHSSHVSMSS